MWLCDPYISRMCVTVSAHSADVAYSGTNQYRAKGEELDDLLSGCVILGAEPVKDGAADAELMLYLKRQNDNLFLLRVSADNEESTLDVFTASLPKEAYS